jgi:uncharacterized CHY-type Zn-finger protein
VEGLALLIRILSDELRKEKRNDYMEKEKIKLCIRCKVALKKTELKDVYKCPACGMITNERLDDR